LLIVAKHPDLAVSASSPRPRVQAQRATGSGDGATWLQGRSRAQLSDLQGDLMIWAPGCPRLSETAASEDLKIRPIADRGQRARGLDAGWHWSLLLPRYTTAGRSCLYEAIVARGYTHVAVQIVACEPGGGYHGLTPETSATCATYSDRLNTVLHELADRHLIPICAGLNPINDIAPDLDRTGCRVAMNDWDDSDEADCRVDRLAREFPDALLYVEVPGRLPKPDRCSPSPFPERGQDWLAAVRRRAPNFMGVLYEVNQPDGVEKNVALLSAAHAWWHDAQQVLFETDTYWKLWHNLSDATARADNDALLRRVPALRGFMSGAAPRQRASERDIVQMLPVPSTRSMARRPPAADQPPSW